MGRMHFVKVFIDRSRFEETMTVRRQDNRHFASGGKSQKPVGLVAQIDILDLVGHFFLTKHSHAALDIRSKIEADNFVHF